MTGNDVGEMTGEMTSVCNKWTDHYDEATGLRLTEYRDAACNVLGNVMCGSRSSPVPHGADP